RPGRAATEVAIGRKLLSNIGYSSALPPSAPANVMGRGRAPGRDSPLRGETGSPPVLSVPRAALQSRLLRDSRRTEARMKILIALPSHHRLGTTCRKTGFWLEELAAPFYVFKDAGAQIVLASPKGGQPPLDPKSNEPNFQTNLTHRFEADAAAQAQLA